MNEDTRKHLTRTIEYLYEKHAINEDNCRSHNEALVRDLYDVFLLCHSDNPEKAFQEWIENDKGPTKKEILHELYQAMIDCDYIKENYYDWIEGDFDDPDLHIRPEAFEETDRSTFFSRLNEDVNKSISDRMHGIVNILYHGGNKQHWIEKIWSMVNDGAYSLPTKELVEVCKAIPDKWCSELVTYAAGIAAIDAEDQGKDGATADNRFRQVLQLMYDSDDPESALRIWFNLPKVTQ